MELETIRINGQRSGLHLLISGGVHGDEFEPMEGARRVARSLDEQQVRGRVTIVPVVNEPAFRLGQRTAEDGLDLARTCPGTADGSVTERIAFALSKLIREADLYIDLHTGGTRLMVQPLVGYMMHPSAEVLEKQRRMAKAFGLPVIWGTDAKLDGRSLSVARDAAVPAIYAEYLGGGQLDPCGVDAYVVGCRNVMSEFAMLDDPVSPSREPPMIVEDVRPGAGHMQVNHPVSVGGFFLPAVKLGETVREGQSLGTVSDPLGNHVQSILARYSGRVLVLHTFARVNAGDSVAVVLETSVG